MHVGFLNSNKNLWIFCYERSKETAFESCFLDHSFVVIVKAVKKRPNVEFYLLFRPRETQKELGPEISRKNHRESESVGLGNKQISPIRHAFFPSFPPADLLDKWLLLRLFPMSLRRRVNGRPMPSFAIVVMTEVASIPGVQGTRQRLVLRRLAGRQCLRTPR